LEFSHHPGIELHGDHLLDERQHLGGEIACARTDLKHHIGGLELGL